MIWTEDEMNRRADVRMKEKMREKERKRDICGDKQERQEETLYVNRHLSVSLCLCLSLSLSHTHKHTLYGIYHTLVRDTPPSFSLGFLLPPVTPVSLMLLLKFNHRMSGA